MLHPIIGHQIHRQFFALHWHHIKNLMSIAFHWQCHKQRHPFRFKRLHVMNIENPGLNIFAKLNSTGPLPLLLTCRWKISESPNLRPNVSNKGNNLAPVIYCSG